MTADALGTQLSDLLDREKAALRAGKLDDLEAFSQEKIEIFQQLEQSGAEMSGAALTRLKHGFSENQRLLTAAMSGLKAARLRLSDIASAQNRLDVYGSDGRKTQVTQSPTVSTKS